MGFRLLLLTNLETDDSRAMVAAWPSIQMASQTWLLEISATGSPLGWCRARSRKDSDATSRHRRPASPDRATLRAVVVPPR